MRLFFALPTDRETRAAAIAASHRMRPELPGYRWSDPEDLHATLVFLGETPDAARTALEAKLHEVARATPPFEVRLGRVGAFDSVEDPRVIWLGVDDPVGVMPTLATALGRTERRPFQGHLTLAYRRGDHSAPDAARILRSQPMVGLVRRIDRLALFASLPQGSHPRYAIVAEAGLGGAGER